jgi:hypothetical protein
LIRIQEIAYSKLQKSPPNLQNHLITLNPIGYTYESVYSYLVESLSTLDNGSVAIPYLLEKPTDKLTFSDRVKLYRELEEALFKAGLGKVLNLGKLPSELMEPTATQD